jgi:acyl-coenzyme A synthetase/AMP-(fatty) acid ligase
MFMGFLQHGSCTIQPTTISFSSEELVAMITGLSLNRLNQFATFLGMQLRNSKRDPKLLEYLVNLDEVLYSGLALGREEEEWALRNGIRLKNLFGNTECGAMLLSIGGTGEDARFLRPIEGTSYDFTPPPSSSTSSSENANANLLELVIRSDSADCPHPSLRELDGNYHTGDLFIQVRPGDYVSRGRDDDWIKSENALRCDTKAIEDYVRRTCADLVDECIVVGNGRPSPALFVEPKVAGKDEKMKKDIIRRIRYFNNGGHTHEKITNRKFVVVVPKGTLPRTATKGNIRRRAVEEAFEEHLDKIYGVSS